MKGLLFAVLFCAVSLIFAETFVTFLVAFSLIEAHEFDEAHSLTMLFLMAIYMGFAPSFQTDFKMPGKKSTKKDDPKQ